MNPGGATAVSFTLLGVTLTWWIVFELWADVRADRLRIRLRELRRRFASDPAAKRLAVAEREAGEWRWLPVLLSAEAAPRSKWELEAAWLLARHVAWGAPWVWWALRAEPGRRLWMRRAWGWLAELEREFDPAR